MKRKGVDILIDAVEHLGPQHNVKVLVAGSGREKAALESKADASGAQIEFLGRISDAEVGDLYVAADLMVMPCRSRWFGLEQEGFGIAFLEAAACGTPQVAARSGGSHEAVAHGETGTVCAENVAPKALAAAIAELIDNPVQLSGYGHNSVAHAAKFDYDLLANKLEESLTNWMLQLDGGSN